MLIQPGPGASSAGNGTPVVGQFDYTDSSGAQRVRFNGLVRYLPFGATTGYRDIRIDYSWRRGGNVGRGQWRNGSTENSLRGTWGWNQLSAGGGQFDIGH